MRPPWRSTTRSQMVRPMPVDGRADAGVWVFAALVQAADQHEVAVDEVRAECRCHLRAPVQSIAVPGPGPRPSRGWRCRCGNSTHCRGGWSAVVRVAWRRPGRWRARRRPRLACAGRRRADPAGWSSPARPGPPATRRRSGSRVAPGLTGRASVPGRAVRRRACRPGVPAPRPSQLRGGTPATGRS